MPDTLLHVTAAQHLTDSELLLPEAATVLRAATPNFALGAVFHDLPFYDRILRNALEKLQNHPRRYSTFGTMLHQRHCAALCIRAVEQATTPSRFAIAAGLISHFWLDTLFHRDIERLVTQYQKPHDVIENDICLHCHYDLLEHAGVGSIYCRTALSIHPHEDWLPFLNGLLADVYQTSLPNHCLQRYLRGLSYFGTLHSAPWLPWVHTLPMDDPEIAALSLRLLDLSLQQAAGAINTAWQCWTDQWPISRLKDAIPDLSMTDGNQIQH